VYDYLQQKYEKPKNTPNVTNSSAVADKLARRPASRKTAKFLKESRDHNHATFVGDKSLCCWN